VVGASVESYGRRGKGAKHVDDDYGAFGLFGVAHQATQHYFHKNPFG
jgi:hypothetical protein